MVELKDHQQQEMQSKLKFHFPDVDGTGSGSLLDSFLSTLLEKKKKKQSSDVWVVDFFFSCYRWHGSTGLHSERLLQLSCTVLRSGPVAQKPIVPPQIRKIPFPFPLPASGNLTGSSGTSSSSCLSSFLRVSNFIISKLLVLHSKFHHSYLALLSSTSYTAAAFVLASGHPGLEIRLLYHCTLYSTVKYTTPQPLIEDARMWQCMLDKWTNLVTGHATHLSIFESLQLESSYVGDSL